MNDNRFVSAIDRQNDGASNTSDIAAAASPPDVTAGRIVDDAAAFSACAALERAFASSFNRVSTAISSARSRSTDDIDDDDGAGGGRCEAADNVRSGIHGATFIVFHDDDDSSGVRAIAVVTPYR